MTPKRPTDHNAQTTLFWTDHHQVIERTLACWAGRARDDQDVQEAIVATYERTLRYLHRGRTIDDNPRARLLTVARREFRRVLERYGRTAELREDEKSQDLIDTAPRPDEILLDHTGRNLDGALDRALARLTPREREVLTDLHAGYTYNEIQERRELSYTALNKALTEGRSKLRNDGALKQAYGEWSD